MTISLTWPQYQRREIDRCGCCGRATKLSRHEADLLLVMVMRQPFPTPMPIMVEALYQDDESGGPLTAEGCVMAAVASLRQKLPQLSIRHRSPRGFDLVSKGSNDA